MIQSQHHYQRYQRFIDGRKGQSVDGYTEVHHIVPRSLGGSDDADNLIRLTARQHYVAHWMLWKAFGGVAGRSFYMMSNLGKYGKVNSQTYAKARENYSHQVKEQMAKKPNIPAFTPEHREKLRQAKLGSKLSEETKRKVAEAGRGRKVSDETRKRISEARRGKGNGRLGYIMPEQTKQRIGDAQRGELNHMTGRKHSQETKEKMRIAHMKRKQDQAYLQWLAEGNVPEPADEPTIS